VDTNCSPDGIDYVIPGNDDAMRAIQLYAAGIADAVIDGKEAIPAVPVSEDEFVELDEEGQPKPKSARRRPAPARKKASIRRKPSAKVLEPRETEAVEPAAVEAAKAPAAAAAVEVAGQDDDLDLGDEDTEETSIRRPGVRRKTARKADDRPAKAGPGGGDG